MLAAVPTRDELVVGAETGPAEVAVAVAVGFTKPAEVMAESLAAAVVTAAVAVAAAVDAATGTCENMGGARVLCEAGSPNTGTSVMGALVAEVVAVVAVVAAVAVVAVVAAVAVVAVVAAVAVVTARGWTCSVEGTVICGADTKPPCVCALHHATGAEAAWALVL